MKYIEQHTPTKGCIFCKAIEETDDLENLVVFRGQYVFAILNRYPYTSGHLMVVPYMHQPSLSTLNSQVRAELMEVAVQAEQVLGAVYHPDGFNVGINIGSAAGAGVASHLHIHVVPRWVGDSNFMTTVAETRVLPEELGDTCKRLAQAWRALD
ncbi:MAG: HIT domain-containing protein [Anaerolineaceae bacterium]|jgi:ATP adenylyltransferase|nr:HIT domain-containing protein [Anaerolineaceae bacterium]